MAAVPPLPAMRPRPRRRWWRRVWRTAVLLLAIVILLVTWLVRNLDQPVVKKRIVALVRAQAGLELDYGATHVAIGSGLDINDVRVAQPAGFSAPPLVAIDAVHARWTLSSLFGSGPPLNSVEVKEVALHVVRAADGRTSLSGLGGTESAP